MWRMTMTVTPKAKVLHIITALNFGGAEAMLAKLMIEFGKTNAPHDHSIITLVTPGRVGRQLIDMGMPVFTLNMKQGVPSPAALVRLFKLVREINPDIVQGWMYHGNVAATFARKCLKQPVRLVWNIRHSLADIAKEKLSSALNIRLGALLSGRADAIIYNATEAVREHKAVGFKDHASLVIPNGFDAVRFRPDDQDRSVRSRLVRDHGISENAVIVGMVARIDPMKSHATMIEAVRIARSAGHHIHLLLAGSGTDALPAHLRTQLDAALPQDCVTLLGDRQDVADWLPGLDIVGLSSTWGEGFPNVLGEAMAAGLPCVATDVGDSRHIIGAAGLCVPPADPHAFAQALGALCDAGVEGRRRIGAQGRIRVEHNYTIDVIARRYSELYQGLLSRRPKSAAIADTSEPQQCAG